MDNNEQKQQFKCTGDCTQCLRVQREYCASQNSYYCLRMVQTMQETVNAMSGTIEEMKAKISAIQDSEASVFIPSLEEKVEGKENDDPTAVPIPIAQEGGGAIE